MAFAARARYGRAQPRRFHDGTAFNSSVTPVSLLVRRARWRGCMRCGRSVSAESEAPALQRRLPTDPFRGATEIHSSSSRAARSWRDRDPLEPTCRPGFAVPKRDIGVAGPPLPIATRTPAQPDNDRSRGAAASARGLPLRGAGPRLPEAAGRRTGAGRRSTGPAPGTRAPWRARRADVARPGNWTAPGVATWQPPCTVRRPRCSPF